MYVGHIHALAFHGLPHNAAVLIAAHGPDVGRLAAQTNSVYRHIDGTAAGVGLAPVHVVVIVDAVASDGRKFHNISSFLFQRVSTLENRT